MFDIFRVVNKKWAENILTKKENKINEIKRQWIEERKLGRRYEEDVDFQSVLSKKMGDLESALGGSSNAPARKGGKLPNKEIKQTFTNENWALIFDQLLSEEKIDVPPDFYDEEILFDDPDQLIDIFS